MWWPTGKRGASATRNAVAAWWREKDKCWKRRWTAANIALRWCRNGRAWGPDVRTIPEARLKVHRFRFSVHGPKNGRRCVFFSHRFILARLSNVFNTDSCYRAVENLYLPPSPRSKTSVVERFVRHNVKSWRGMGHNHSHALAGISRTYVCLSRHPTCVVFNPCEHSQVKRVQFILE